LQKFVFENFQYEDGANSVPGDVMPTFEGFMKVTCGSRHECPWQIVTVLCHTVSKMAQPGDLLWVSAHFYGIKLVLERARKRKSRAKI